MFWDIQDTLPILKDPPEIKELNMTTVKIQGNATFVGKQFPEKFACQIRENNKVTIMKNTFFLKKLNIFVF